MKKPLSLALIAMLPLLVPGCFRQELQVAEYHVPGIASPAAETYVRTRLKTLPGVKDVSGNLETHTLTVSYQSSITRSMNIEEAIAMLGFAANNRPANPNAKLPKELTQSSAKK